jgi:hypothetical protein
VIDDTSYIDVDIVKERNFFSYKMEKLELSYENKWGTSYKVAGVTVFRDLNLEQINRRTYKVLNFMGDVGGLDAVLMICGYCLINWF